MSRQGSRNNNKNNNKYRDQNGGRESELVNYRDSQGNNGPYEDPITNQGHKKP